MNFAAMFKSGSLRGTNLEQIFSRPLQVLVRNGSDEKRITLHLTIERIVSGLKREVLVRLTDDGNLYFFYNLVLTEDDFQLLKSQQGLLVDFSLFPQKFVDLLELCIQEQHKDSPKFLLSLPVHTLGAPLESSTSATLNVVETNPFKHLIHLSLKLVSGSENDVKKHLVACLDKVKNEKLEAQRMLEITGSELRQKCEYMQELLSSRTAEVEKLKHQLRQQTSELTLKQTEQINSHKDSVMELRNEYEMKMEKSKQELTTRYQRMVAELEERATSAESENKIMASKLNRAEANLSELQAQISNLEPELHRVKSELQNLRRNSGSLESQYHELKQKHGYLQTRVSVMEQELKDRELVLSNNQQLLQVTQEQKVHLENQVGEKTALVSKRENALKMLSEEVKKANEIIAKLQKEIKTSHAKLKVRGQIATEQEKVLTQNDDLLKRIMAEKEALQGSNESKETQLEKLANELQNAEKHLKTNENVINWLNKQLNEVQLGRGVKLVGNLPQPRLLNYYDSHIQPTGAASAMPSRMATPHAATVTFAPANRIETRPMRAAALGEQYFRRSVPLLHSTPHIRSSVPVSHPQSRSKAAVVKARTKLPSSTLPHPENIVTQTPDQPDLRSAYFAKQASST